MAIGVYYQPEGFSFEQYDRFYRLLNEYLQEQGLDAPKGALHLSVFGDDGQLAGFEIWESEEAFREFSTVLGPIIEEVGIRGAVPQIMPIHRLTQTAAVVDWALPR